jgi:hypothetical protein
MKKYSILITDTDYDHLYLIEDDHKKVFFANVCSSHETLRSDLAGKNDEEREKNY